MLRFTPSAILLDSFNEEGKHVEVVKLQNISTAFLKISIDNELSENVIAKFVSGEREFKKVAPGVIVEVEVTVFPVEGMEDGVHFSFNTNNTDGVVFPVEFHVPKPSIRVVSCADFGTLSLNDEVHEKWISFVNDGNAGANFELQMQDVHDSRVKIPTISAIVGHALSRANETSLCIEFFANKLGICHETVRVMVDGEVHAELEIKANVLPQSLDIIDPITEQEVSQIDMGCVYYGTEREFKEIIFNNRLDETMFVISPVSLFAWVYTANGREKCSSYATASDVVIPTPIDGTLSRFEKRVCKFTFQPLFPFNDDNVVNLPYHGRRDFTCTFKMECVTDKRLSHTITFTGSAIVPSFRIEKNRIKFDECLVGEEEHETFVIENVSNQLPLTFEVESMAHFKFTPSKGIILADSLASIDVKFIPKQPGKLKRSAKVKLGHDTAFVTIPIEGIGVAGRRDEMTLRATQRAKSGFNHPKHKSNKHVPKSAPLDTGHRQQSVFSKTNMRKATARLRPLTHAHMQRHNESRGNMSLKNDSTASSVCVGQVESEVNDRRYSPTLTAISHISQPSKKFSVTSMMSVASSVMKPSSKKGKHRLKSDWLMSQASSTSNSLRTAVVATSSLRPRDLQKLTFDPEGPLNFGSVCVSSVGKRIITIKNHLNEAVVIQAACHREEISVSIASQLVEPQGSTRLAVVLAKITDETPVSLQSHISVIVNKVHTLKIPVQATVVPFSVSLSSNHISLSCGYCVKASRPCSYVTVTNSFGRECFYYWEVYETPKGESSQTLLTAGGAFAVVPVTGCLGAHADTQVQVSLFPEKYNVGSKYEIVLVLEGSDEVQRISCQANFAHSKCRFVESRTVFGTISQSSSNNRIAVLTNEGRVDAYFDVKEVNSRFGLSDISISPSSGMVPARSTLELDIACKASRLGKLDANIILNVKDQKPLSHIISGQVVPIKLHVDRDSFDFGHMLLGQTRTLPFSVTNNSGCDVVVSFDYGSLVGFSTHTEVFGGADTNINSITVATGISQPLHMQLTAQEVCSFGSRVTIAANNINVTSLDVCGTVLAASVSVSPRTIDFGSLILGDNATKVLSLKYSGTAMSRLYLECSALIEAGISLDHKDLQKYNESIHGKATSVPTSRAVTPPTSNSARQRSYRQKAVSRTVSKNGGNGITTQEGETVVPMHLVPTDNLFVIDLGDENGADVEVTLDTNEPFGLINISLPVYLSTNDSEPFLVVQVKAKELAPELQVTEKSFFLGCLPVKQEKILSFSIKSIGYVEEADIDYTLERKGDGREVNDAAMTIIFPKGKTLRPYMELPVEVHIYSSSSTDFDQNLVLFDNVENSCSVRIAGMVDSTIFSKIVNVPFDSKEFGVMANGLKRYFQIYGLPSAFHLTIPKSFTQKCGWLLADIINHLSNIKIPNLPLTRPETLSLQQKLTLMENILQFLIARGALLQEVVAEDLLIAGPRQHRAWVLVLAQVARVLVLGQLPVRIGRAPRQSIVGNGFVTHPHEKLVHVMEWVNYSIQSRGKKALTQSRVTNFEEDFRDGLVLADLILAHVPELEDNLGNSMFPVCNNETKFYHNAISIVRALKHLKIYLNIDVQDIVEPCEPFITIVVVQLAVMLPQFLCEEELVDVTGSLGASTTAPAVFENSDPKRPITYHILPFGSTHFKVPDKIRVGPNSKETVQCKVNSNVSGKHSCHLISVGYYGGCTVPNMMRHLLRAAIVRRPSSTALQMETKCYDQQTRLLCINKPFRSCQVCSIMTSETTASGEVLTPHYPSFWVDDESVDFSKAHFVEIGVHFLPTRLGEHHFTIALRDDTTGTERCYGVVGIANTPDPLQTISWTSQLQKVTKLKVQVPFTNDARRAALSKISLTTERLHNLTVAPRVSAPLTSKQECVELNVEIVGSAHVTGPSKLTLYPPPAAIPLSHSTRPKLNKTMQSSLSVVDELEHSSDLELTFKPVAAGSYSFDVHLIGPEDVRVYRMHGDVSESLEVETITEAELGMTSRVPLALCNPCDSSHTFELSIEGDTECFSCDDSMVIEGHGQDTLMLEYTPKKVGHNKCTVVARDTFTDVTSYFHIHARGHPEVDRSKPMSSSRSRSAVSAKWDKSIIVECDVWESKPFSIRLRNENREATTFSLTFESSQILEEEVVFDEEVHVGPLGSEVISCEYFPLRDGMFTGMLLVDDNVSSVRPIKLEFISNPPDPISLPVVGVIMNTSVVVDIPVTNPSLLPLVVTVDENCSSDTYQFDPPELHLGGNETGVFHLKVSPTRFVTYSIGDPNEHVVSSKEIVLRGDYGIRWDYLLPISIYPEGCVGGDGDSSEPQPHVVGGKCEEEDLFEIEISNSDETPREYSVALVQDESRKGKAEFILLKSKIRVSGHGSRGLPMCFLPHVVCKHTATVIATPKDPSLPEKRWALIGLGQPSKKNKPCLLKCVTDTRTTRTFTISLFDIDPDCDVSKLNANLDGFDTFTTAECSILEMTDNAVKVVCEIEADLANKSVGTLEVYHEDGFYWERMLTVVSHAPLVDTLELQATSIRGKVYNTAIFNGDLTEDGYFSVFFVDEKSCFEIVGEDCGEHVRGTALHVNVSFDPKKSKGNSSTELVVRFLSGKEYAIQLQGVQPGL
eukprot:m.43212 g.43212  ORF g.43212 m.43212 type:complete len:2618 (-) comp10540_c0_seq10:1948-9801(-)